MAWTPASNSATVPDPCGRVAALSFNSAYNWSKVFTRVKVTGPVSVHPSPPGGQITNSEIPVMLDLAGHGPRSLGRRQLTPAAGRISSSLVLGSHARAMLLIVSWISTLRQPRSGPVDRAAPERAARPWAAVIAYRQSTCGPGAAASVKG